MTDQQRSDASNGIWLCGDCATKIDADESYYTVALLNDWKAGHEAWVKNGCPSEQRPLREVTVKDGGIGSVRVDEGSGSAMRIVAPPGQPGERVSVEGRGVGEMIVNTGSGTAKVISSNSCVASESRVTVNQPVPFAAGLSAKVVLKNCSRCGCQFPVSKVLQAFAGDEEPKVEVRCPNPNCRATLSV
jgi:hypothetical protein